MSGRNRVVQLAEKTATLAELRAVYYDIAVATVTNASSLDERYRIATELVKKLDEALDLNSDLLAAYRKRQW